MKSKNCNGSGHYYRGAQHTNPGRIGNHHSQEDYSRRSAKERDKERDDVSGLAGGHVESLHKGCCQRTDPPNSRTSSVHQ